MAIETAAEQANEHCRGSKRSPVTRLRHGFLGNINTEALNAELHGERLMGKYCLSPEGSSSSLLLWSLFPKDV